MNLLDYTPPPTLEKFMLDGHLIRVAVGPLGSGKSMACIMELVRRACEQRPHNGVRYTRFACVRNTLQQLRQTVLADITQYLGEVTSYYSTDSTVRLRFSLGDGTEVHSDFMLIPLDTKEDVRRLLSLQLTGAWVNELREVPLDIIRPLLGRCGRYPSKVNGGFTWRGIIADSNPWDTDSPYHDRLVLNPHRNWKLFHQPSGIGPTAENRDNLPPNYYEDMMDERDSEFVAVHVESEWGTSNAGQAVFKRSFHAPSHVRNLQQVTNPHRPLIVGIDFGRTPSALIGQVDNYGRRIIYREVVSEDMGLVQFLEDKLLPALAQPPFASRHVIIVGDPAGGQQTQTRDESPFSILKDRGLKAYAASTNDPERRIIAVEKSLRGSSGGEPMLQISRDGCPTLIMAMGNKYRYRKKKDGQLEERPEKLHPWSDICDALQYFCLGADQNLVGKLIDREHRRSIPRERMPTGAWT